MTKAYCAVNRDATPEFEEKEEFRCTDGTSLATFK